jgi:hypothetical protein
LKKKEDLYVAKVPSVSKLKIAMCATEEISAWGTRMELTGIDRIRYLDIGEFPDLSEVFATLAPNPASYAMCLPVILFLTLYSYI